MWLGVFNNKFILQRAKAFVKLVENNKDAEILMDKIKGVEHQYESIAAYQHRYENLVRTIVYDFNSKFASGRNYNNQIKIDIQNICDYNAFEPTSQIILVHNRQFHLREEITYQMTILSREDMAFEKIYNLICMEGMKNLFLPKDSKEKKLHIVPVTPETVHCVKEGEEIPMQAYILKEC